MNPTDPQKLYKKTASKLNLPEEYVKDLVEYYYKLNKDGMHTISYIIFFIVGLGRFRIRPFKFWKIEKARRKLLDEFEVRKDDRGIMIRKELEERYNQMQEIAPSVQEYYEQQKIKMYGNKKNLE